MLLIFSSVLQLYLVRNIIYLFHCCTIILWEYVPKLENRLSGCLTDEISKLLMTYTAWYYLDHVLVFVYQGVLVRVMGSWKLGCKLVLHSPLTSVITFDGMSIGSAALSSQSWASSISSFITIKLLAILKIWKMHLVSKHVAREIFCWSNHLFYCE